MDDGRLQHVPGAYKRAGREREDIGELGRAFGGNDEKNKKWWIRAGEYIEYAYTKIPKIDRVYRWAIPLGFESKSGKVAYIPLPNSEIGQVRRGFGLTNKNNDFRRATTACKAGALYQLN